MVPSVIVPEFVRSFDARLFEVGEDIIGGLYSFDTGVGRVDLGLTTTAACAFLAGVLPYGGGSIEEENVAADGAIFEHFKTHAVILLNLDLRSQVAICKGDEFKAFGIRRRTSIVIGFRIMSVGEVEISFRAGRTLEGKVCTVGDG